MFWIILLCLLAVGVVAGIIFSKFGNSDMMFIGESMTVICGLFLVVGLLVFPIVYVNQRSSINQFKQQSAYLQSHISNNAVEDAALTSKKIELNTWLYNAQYEYEHYRLFSVYPAEISTLKPIE